MPVILGVSDGGGEVLFIGNMRFFCKYSELSDGSNLAEWILDAFEKYSIHCIICFGLGYKKVLWANMSLKKSCPTWRKVVLIYLDLSDFFP